MCAVIITWQCTMYVSLFVCVCALCSVFAWVRVCPSLSLCVFVCVRACVCVCVSCLSACVLALSAYVCGDPNVAVYDLSLIHI